MWNLKKCNTHELIYKNRSRPTEKENKLTVTKEKGGKDKLGFGDLNIYYHTENRSIYKELLYSTGNYIQYLLLTYIGGECRKKKHIFVYLYIIESLCCTSETNTASLMNYMPLVIQWLRLHASQARGTG